jgi:catechol 2,3-dioxygenase
MLPAATRMGRVDLSVSDLGRSLDYYTNAIGLSVLSQNSSEVTLGVGSEELLRLVEEPGARPATGFSGLFHVALLVPERDALARWLAHAARDGVQLTGASDHTVSEALYLRDPDRHGIEIYADRPREQWEGRVGQLMGTAPLDLDGLLRTLPQGDGEFSGLPDGTRVGHVHLCVADVDESVGFYRDRLGLDLVAQLGPQAAFLSAGGYHHHLAVNTWESRGAPAAPEGTARLLDFRVVLPDVGSAAEAGERVGGAAARDPSGNALLIAS